MQQGSEATKTRYFCANSIVLICARVYFSSPAERVLQRSPKELAESSAVAGHKVESRNFFRPSTLTWNRRPLLTLYSDGVGDNFPLHVFKFS